MTGPDRTNADNDADAPSSDAVKTNGAARPELLDDLGALVMERTFVFIDLCAFTAFTDRHGPAASVDALERFRSNVRRLAARRGVRVAKWLGDGALLVSVRQAPAVAVAVEITDCFEGGLLRCRAGLACGRALLFDGDDYVGRPLNLASRLCEHAEAGEVIGADLEHVPDWVNGVDVEPVVLKGLGSVDARRYTADATICLPARHPL